MIKVEICFIIRASSRDVLWNRLRIIRLNTSIDFCIHEAHEDEEGGIWKNITVANFESISKLRNAIQSVKKYKWLYLQDSWICLEHDSECIFLSGGDGNNFIMKNMDD